YLQLNQPLFAFNRLKWEKQIEPLKYQESERDFTAQLESIAQESTKLVFDILEAQNNMEIARVNLKNTEANFGIEMKRINLGTTTEDKLLQLELQVLKSRQDLEKANYDYKVAQLNLKTFIGSKETKDLTIKIPEEIPFLVINVDTALNYARRFRPEVVAFE